MCANANLFSYVESTAVSLRMEPAAAKGFSQDGIVRFLQTLVVQASVFINPGRGHSSNNGIALTDNIYLGLLVKTRQVPS